MTPIERYTFLKTYWRQQIDERNKELEEAKQQFEHWAQRLVQAEIAKKLAEAD